jgi:hypothetical protein
MQVHRTTGVEHAGSWGHIDAGAAVVVCADRLQSQSARLEQAPNQLGARPPYGVNVDGDAVLGWALLAKGATGIACEHRDRVYMWLGTGQAVIPESIYTKTVDRLRMSGRIL